MRWSRVMKAWFNAWQILPNPPHVLFTLHVGPFTASVRRVLFTKCMAWQWTWLAIRSMCAHRKVSRMNHYFFHRTNMPKIASLRRTSAVHSAWVSGSGFHTTLPPFEQHCLNTLVHFLYLKKKKKKKFPFFKIPLYSFIRVKHIITHFFILPPSFLYSLEFFNLGVRGPLENSWREALNWLSYCWSDYWGLYQCEILGLTARLAWC